MDSGTIKWCRLFLGILGIGACILYMVDKDYRLSFWFIASYTVFCFISSIYHFIKDTPYKGDKKSGKVKK